MNKFGIFNLLNSFFDFYGNKKSDQPEQASNPAPDKNPLENLFSSLNVSPAEKAKPVNSTATRKPLISPLLNTMNAHEQFVKRVNAKTK